MADIFDPKKRSAIMSRIRGKNTRPEKTVFSYLHKGKIYFQKHYGGVAGNPDIALPRKKRAVFIDGDFWHGRTFRERRYKLPAYWKKKIKRNIERDREYRKTLVQSGWKILQVWESDILGKNSKRTLRKIEKFLKK